MRLGQDGVRHTPLYGAREGGEGALPEGERAVRRATRGQAPDCEKRGLSALLPRFRRERLARVANVTTPRPDSHKGCAKISRPAG